MDIIGRLSGEQRGEIKRPHAPFVNQLLKALP
jgi:hypothetical protein